MALALLDLTALEAPAFFADTDAEELVAAVRSAGDEELLRLIRDEEIRSAAVAGIIARLHEYAVPERLAAAKGGHLKYGAAVAGGIPVIPGLEQGLAGDRIARMEGILNGTCNFILSKMEAGAE